MIAIFDCTRCAQTRRERALRRKSRAIFLRPDARPIPQLRSPLDPKPGLDGDAAAPGDDSRVQSAVRAVRTQVIARIEIFGGLSRKLIARMS